MNTEFELYDESASEGESAWESISETSSESEHESWNGSEKSDSEAWNSSGRELSPEIIPGIKYSSNELLNKAMASYFAKQYMVIINKYIVIFNKEANYPDSLKKVVVPNLSLHLLPRNMEYAVELYKDIYETLQ